jgi:hypothetical protein
LKLCGLAHQGLSHPSSGLFGCPEQGCILDVALAEPSFQVPPTPMRRVMVRPVKAHEHGSELVICEDEVAISVVAVDEHARSLKG